MTGTHGDVCCGDAGAAVVFGETAEAFTAIQPTPTLVAGQTFTVAEAGTYHVTADGTGDFGLATATEANTFSAFSLMYLYVNGAQVSARTISRLTYRLTAGVEILDGTLAGSAAINKMLALNAGDVVQIWAARQGPDAALALGNILAQLTWHKVS